MKPAVRSLLFWAPRVMTIAFILFLGLFALDVFGEGYGFWDTLVALFMHLVPNFVLLAVLFVAWKREWVGALVFLALGIFYIAITWERGHWSWWVGISGPLFVLSLLFLLNWVKRDQLRVRAS